MHQEALSEVQSPEIAGASPAPAIVINGGNVQFFGEHGGPVRGFMGPAESDFMGEQIKALEELQILAQGTGQAVNDAKAKAGIELNTPAQTADAVVGDFTQMIADQRAAANDRGPSLA